VERIDLDRESRPNHKALRYVGGAKNRKNSTNLAKGENPHMVARADAWRVKAATRQSAIERSRSRRMVKMGPKAKGVPNKLARGLPKGNRPSPLRPPLSQIGSARQNRLERRRYRSKML
jgi:hypothetical protein